MQHLPKVMTGRRGATATEFAVCAPIAFALIFGIIEYSRARQLEHTLRLAAFEGARAGVTLDSSTTDVQNRVQSVLQAVRIPNAQVVVSPNPLSYTSPTVTVTVTADSTKNAWVTWFIPKGTTIKSAITLNREVLAVSAPGP